MEGINSMTRTIALPTLSRERPDTSHACASSRPWGMQRRLIDSHGRVIRDLRISITDRCNFRCTYCMSTDCEFAETATLLTPREFVRVARIAETLGIRKIRLTGGEPTLHPQLEQIIAEIRQATTVEIALITNGSRLTRDSLARLQEAGLSRVTMSLDALDEERFATITRSTTTPQRVIAAIEDCISLGFSETKVNAVLIRGVNDGETLALANLARRYAIDVRFIEYMPLDAAHAWDASKFVSAAETRRHIETSYPLLALDSCDPSATASLFAFADGAAGRIGFIAPVSSPFCGACSRLRLTADGKLRPCLFSTDEWDVRDLLRWNASDASIADRLLEATWNKQSSHGISGTDFVQPRRGMSAIGG